MFENLWRRAGRTVLIVSEDPATPVLDGGFLEQPDIRLLTSYPNDEGLEIARRERPNLIIEDLSSPDGAGMRFCRDLHENRLTRSIPLIVLAEPDHCPDAGPSGASALLHKPLGRRELYRAVQRFLPLPTRRVDRILTNLRFTFHVDEQRFQAFSRDVSERGAFLKTDRHPPLGTPIDLCFRLPGCWSEIRCRGTVRSTSDGDGHPHSGGIGIEFRDLAPADRERLEAFIERQRHPRHF